MNIFGIAFFVCVALLVGFVLIQLNIIVAQVIRQRREERKIDLIVNPDRADEKQILTHVLDATRKSQSALEQ